MAFIRNCIVIIVLLCCLIQTKAQTIYYPAGSSQLLKATAGDLAMLLQKAITTGHFTVQEYTAMPATGIIFIYNEGITDNQTCKVESDGATIIKFSASQDNGLHFGIYQYLHQCGFRFYQPGTIWEIIPALSSPFKNLDTTFTCNYKYKSWYLSGGCNRWLMDRNDNYGWDTYYGENGHNWALYQRRNGMTGANNFTGHRGDIMNVNYLATLQNNPCYVACFEGSRNANAHSVPDINNSASLQLWGDAIEKKYSQFKDIIYSNPALYANFYRNFNYYNGLIGIEVPDGAQWANSKDNGNCSSIDYLKESDQNFLLANSTAKIINTKYPDKHFQLYAYSTHADVPDVSIAINKNIDVQIIPEVYQLESSTNGLRNRWYNRSSKISEYNYLNLSGWSGEIPSFKWSDLKTTLQIAKDKKSQGLIWEASPAKFGSLPFLLAANNYLKDDITVDSTLHEFCNNLFGSANQTIFKMLQLWGETETTPDKYKMQLFVQLLNTAVQQTRNEGELIKERIRELKAYLHYMILYFNLAKDDQNKMPVEFKDAAICIYLAKINKLQLVNSYYLITGIVSKYPATSNFYSQYNITNGTAYQNGNLPLITNDEIDNNFLQDVGKYNNLIEQFKFETATSCKDRFNSASIAPLDKINTKIYYTNGMNYYNKTTFYILAPAAGNFNVKYTPGFNIPGKGYINFLVENADKTLQIIKDLSLDKNSSAGIFTVTIPSAGRYIFTIVSKYKSVVELTITTNGNYFYKDGAFLGNKTEDYRTDLTSLPGYFYIPAGLNKIYFTVNNSFSDGKYASAETITKSFEIKDNNGTLVRPDFVNPKDSSLFYFNIPANAAGTFWQATKTEQYNLQFVNISNLLWYARRRSECNSARFTVSVVNVNGNCITRLRSDADPLKLKWEISDSGYHVNFENQNVVDLPDHFSTNTIVTLVNENKCSFTKRIGDDEQFIKTKESCKGTARSAADNIIPVLYPNPSNGTFNCLQNGLVINPDKIIITNASGIQVGIFKDVNQFNISHTAAGIYWYRILVKNVAYSGKLIKL